MQDTIAETPPTSAGTPEQPGDQAHLAVRLSAAAIGVSGLDHYLPAFVRLDAAGRAVALWNWAAAIAGPMWLVYRSLWRGLAIDLAWILAVVAAVKFAHDQALLPGAVLAGVALALWLASAVALGLWGDALVHRDARRRIEAAVARSQTMQQALGQLQSDAPSRRRMWLVAALGALTCAAVVMLALPWSGAGKAGPAPERGAPEVKGAVTAAPQPPTPAAQTLPLPPVQQTEPARVPAFDVDEAQAVQGETDVALAALAAKGHGAAATGKKAGMVGGPHPAPSGPGQKAGEGPKSAAAAQPAPQMRGLYINVGAFADPANAARTRERLRKEGLPVEVEVLTRPQSKVLQRVRVGPFTSAAQANEAAATIRRLGLDAVPAVQ